MDFNIIGQVTGLIVFFILCGTCIYMFFKQNKEFGMK